MQEIQILKKMNSIMKKQPLIIGLMLIFLLIVNGCAPFKTPTSINEAPILDRALSEEKNGIRASAAVVGDEEARQIFGIDLAHKNIQAVWIEIENNADYSLSLLPTAIDPNYFAPLEVTYAYHRAFAADANTMLDEHILKLIFPVRKPILPGSRVSGYIFTNKSGEMKVIDVDLVGNSISHNFTFFAANPELSERQGIFKRMETLFAESELKRVESETGLRQALEQLPCCVSSENGGPSEEPLNIVIIGDITDWTTAFVRRAYVYHELTPRYAFGRTQDLSGQKLSRGYTKAQSHTLRIWQTPIRYQGKPIWIGQSSSRLGGRFSEKAPLEVTLPIDPYVDEARNDLSQDLAYSQVLVKIGYAKGSGESQGLNAAESTGDVKYTTDGLRVVLVFGDRPTSLATIDFFNWERLADYQ